MTLNLRRRALHILLAVDQAVWTFATLGYGYPDETISAGAYRLEQEGKLFGKYARPFIDWLFFWQTAHCYNAFVEELDRSQNHPRYKV